MNIFQTIVLGVIQGITEFLPISSSAHLIAIRYIFNLKESSLGNLSFDIALHFGTVMAIILYFYKDFMLMVKEGFKFKKNGVISASCLSPMGKMFWYIIIASIPAAISGVLLDDFIEEYIRESSFTPIIISVTLAIMGYVLYITDKSNKEEKDINNMTLKDACLIGISQAFAIIPGFSRSGTTMSMARARKLDRVSAAKFSFFLGVPVILGASILKFKDLTLTMINIEFILGIVVSFIVGLICIKFLMNVLNKIGFKYFAIYRLLLAVVLVITYIIR